MDKKTKFLKRVKSAQSVKQLGINDILDLAIQQGLGLQEAFIEVKKALLKGELSANSVDIQVLNIFNATHLRQDDQKSPVRLAFEQRIVDEVKRIEQTYITHLQTYQEQQLRKDAMKEEQQAERDKRPTMSAELRSLLSPKLRLKK